MTDRLRSSDDGDIGFRWRRMLEDGRYASVRDVARAEKVGRTYAGDILRLTLLAPEIVEAIVEGRKSVEVTLPGLMAGVAAEREVCWREPAPGMIRAR